jgi:DNA invertase Pin-like site-specific DNA recombinase
MRVAIYCRVSTGEQELANQREALLQSAQARGWRVAVVYEDIGSGAKADREGFRKLLQDVTKRKFDAIYVWALDRLSREGLSRTVQLIEQLDKWGVRIVSHTEPYLDTSNELVRSILLAVIATLAKLERQKISERTKAGLERARRQGKKLGRPSVLEDEELCVRTTKDRPRAPLSACYRGQGPECPGRSKNGCSGRGILTRKGSPPQSRALLGQKTVVS